jgi:hypothetical protein
VAGANKASQRLRPYPIQHLEFVCIRWDLEIAGPLTDALDEPRIVGREARPCRFCFGGNQQPFRESEKVFINRALFRKGTIGFR